MVDVNTVDFSGKDIGGIIFQYPDTEGSIHNFGEIISQARYTLDFESKNTGITAYFCNCALQNVIELWNGHIQIFYILIIKNY